jgi:hypothetical protein
MERSEGQDAPTQEQAQPGVLSRDPDRQSLDQAVARLLRKPEEETPEAKPKKEPERKRLEEADETTEEWVETEEESEGEVEDDESDTQTDSEETEEESEEETEEQEGELYFSVKIDGEEYEVSADELKSGYQRQKDYTKKTQQLAEQRKEYDAKLQELTAYQEDFIQKATMANELLNRDLQKFSKIDWDKLKAEDPVGYVQKQIEMSDVQKSQAQLKAEAQRIFEHNQKVQQEEHAKYLEAQRKDMLDYFPDWKSPDKAQAHQGKIIEYAKVLGYTDEELRSVDNAKNLLVLDKARKYDELQKAKKGITQKSKPTMRKLVKPKGTPAKGTAQKKVMVEASNRLRKSGSIRDAAALMYEMRNSKVITKPK